MATEEKIDYDAAIAAAKTPEEKAKLAVEKSKKTGVLGKLEKEQQALEKEVKMLETFTSNLKPPPPDDSGCEKQDFFDKAKPGWTVGSRF